jgi:L-amino acid N-acyltransferase YncA
MIIHSLSVVHWPQVKSIYEQGIASGHATFQTSAPDWEQWDKAHIAIPRLVMTEDDRVLAWAALSPVSSRSVYAGVAEVSIYVAAENQGRGIGKHILEQLILQSEHNNFWTLQAAIFPENKPSLKIHERLGFRVIGERERIGKMNGIWRSTILMERRSKIVGC